jgi:hypothetical protein
MLKACQDCAELRTVSSQGNWGKIECGGHPPQRVPDVWEHLRVYCCPNFRPKHLTRPEDDPILALCRKLADAKVRGLSEALARWLSGPPNDVEFRERGMQMLMVSDGNLRDFESDSELKAFKLTNHAFADILGVPRSKVLTPILFWLSRENDAGVSLTSPIGDYCTVIALGPGYGFAELCVAVNAALSRQKVYAGGLWFAKYLKEAGLDPADEAFSHLLGGPQ